MKHIIAAGIVLFAVVGGLVYADSQWSDETRVKVAPVTPIVIPAIYYYTAVPEPRIPMDLWRCLQNPTLALNAPDVALDHNLFDVIDLRITPIGELGQIHVYQVFNHGRNEAKPITVEYGTDGAGHVVLVRCDVPAEWGNFPPDATLMPLPTNVNQPGDGVGQPES